jgi:hypothetical protein
LIALAATRTADRTAQLASRARFFLISKNVNVVTISKRLGHSSPAITLQVDAHLFAENDRARRIDAAFGAA